MHWLGQWGAVWAAAAWAVVVAVAGGVATRLGPWYDNLRKPSWQPPDWLFGPAWTAIFALTAASGVRAWWGTADGVQRWLTVGLFVVNGLLNFFWSVLFFTLRRPDWALVEVVPLWLSILAMMIAFAVFAPPASLLLLPYLAWVGFAAFLNRAVVRLNAPFHPVR